MNAAEVEAFVDHMRSGPESTARYYLVDLRMFLKYLTDPRYGWGKVCVARSGVGLRELLGTRQAGRLVDLLMDALTKDSARADPTLPDERVERTRACGHACPAANAARTVHVNYGVERWQGSRPTPASRHRLEMAKAPC